MTDATQSLHIRLNTGELVDLLNPGATQFSMRGIAQALSKLCRFSGQVRAFYSVAEHSVLVSQLAERLGGDPWGALWHEAGEGLGLNDMVTPLKRLMPDYVGIENGVLEEVGRQFGFVYPFDAKVELADKLLCEVEGTVLMPGWVRQISPQLETHVQGIHPACLDPDEALAVFLDRMTELTGRRG